MKRALLYVHALTPLHPGTGQALDVIDLPVARERSTGLPLAPGSSVKGVLRAEARDLGWPQSTIWGLFGPDTQNASEFAGSTLFGDARLLLFPMRSVTNLFAWVTSPYLLRRYLADREEAFGPESNAELKQAGPLGSPGRLAALTAAEEMIVPVGARKVVLLEDADLDATRSPELARLATGLAQALGGSYWPAMLPAHLVLVSDGLLGSFVHQATEITARVKLKEEEKTVAKGGLWYEESLPTETLLYAPVLFDQARGNGEHALSPARRLELLRQIRSLQLGGKASVGRGLCRISWEAREGA